MLGEPNRAFGVRRERHEQNQRATHADRRRLPGQRRRDHHPGNTHGLQRKSAGVRAHQGVELDHRVTSEMLAIVRPV